MPNSRFAAVITTVQAPTKSVIQVVERLHPYNATLIVIGDKKGPESYVCEGSIEFYPLARQLDLDFSITRRLPTGHYSRKNIGYLIAVAQGAGCIYETDDDNAPLQNWSSRTEKTDAFSVLDPGWANVYQFFSNARIWPRGFPLQYIKTGLETRLRISESTIRVNAPIQQGLVNNSPDCDAIWHLLLGGSHNFEPHASVHLPEGTWCPFNSQSTWWWPDAFPLLYLPTHCSFRMTDIWRSFIAQRCIWELGCGLVFHGPEVIQERNEHDLLRDFMDEVPGYQRNHELANILENLSLSKGRETVAANMITCYEALVNAGFFHHDEIKLASLWIHDMRDALKKSHIAAVPS